MYGKPSKKSVCHCWKALMRVEVAGTPLTISGLWQPVLFWAYAHNTRKPFSCNCLTCPSPLNLAIHVILLPKLNQNSPMHCWPKQCNNHSLTLTLCVGKQTPSIDTTASNTICRSSYMSSFSKSFCLLFYRISIFNIWTMICAVILTTSLWVFAIRLSSAKTLGLCCWVVQVHA